MQYRVEHQGPMQPIHEPRFQPHALSILLVEDDMNLRRALEMSLSHLGHVVLCASKAADVKPMLEGFRVDLIISDHRLPDGTSDEVMATIRDVAPNVPAIVMSGYLDSEIRATIDVTAALWRRSASRSIPACSSARPARRSADRFELRGETGRSGIRTRDKRFCKPSP